MKVKRRNGNGKDKPPDNKKVVDLQLFKGGKKDKILSPEQLTELRKELDEYKVTIPTSEKDKEFIKIAQAIIDNSGFIMRTAISLGMSYSRFSKILKTNKKLQDIMQDVNEATLDLAENKLRDQILMGNLAAIIYFLSNKGAVRGWRNSYMKPGDIVGGEESEKKVPNFKYETVLPKNFKLVPVEEEKAVEC